VPKRFCTSRAEWRLQAGKPPEAISAHYRLDCDYGTGVITCWEDGGSEPIYVCESHAKQLGRPRRQQISDIRVVTSETNNPASKTEEPAEVEAAPAVMNAMAPEPARGVAATTVAAAPSSNAFGDPPKSDNGASVREPAAPTAKTAAKPARSPERPERKTARAVESTAATKSSRDRIYGDPSKAIVDEAIWNMPAGNLQAYQAALAQGKSAAEAAEAAGGQMAMVHRKIGDYTLRLENFLSASRAKISMAEAVDKPLENAVQEIIASDGMSDSEKDAAIQGLGSLQEWAKHGWEGEITLLQTNRIVFAIGERVNWGGAADVPERFKPVYRTLFDNLKGAICRAAPETQNLHDRLTNLYAAKSDLEVLR